MNILLPLAITLALCVVVYMHHRQKQQLLSRVRLELNQAYLTVTNAKINARAVDEASRNNVEAAVAIMDGITSSLPHRPRTAASQARKAVDLIDESRLAYAEHSRPIPPSCIFWSDYWGLLFGT